MKKALLFEPLENKTCRCKVCLHRCMIPSGEVGVCGTRLNREGVLYSLIYGVTSGVQVDPIEKKPFYHFHPGTKVFSLGSWGCNFRCKHCQNDWCSWGEPATAILQRLKTGEKMVEITPEWVVKSALSCNCQGVASTYNEPGIWLEFNLEVFKLAKKVGLYTCYVTNGYATKEHLDLIGPYLDGYSVDFKSFSAKTQQKIGAGVKFMEIAENTKYVKEKYGTWVEVTTLIIPTINDNLEELAKMARWIKKNLGEETPWHLSRFFPAAKCQNLPPTQIETLEKVQKIGTKEGLKYVYLGNI